MAWKAEYLILILISTLIDYLAGLRMGAIEEKRLRKKYLTLSILSNLGLLFSFKYFNFFSVSVRDMLSQYNIFYDAPLFNYLLPVGISFYTFQSLSYSIDVYRGERKPEKHIGYFALYVAYFPQLVAGPIERSTNLLPQFFKKQNFDYQRITDGLKLMLWGFFKKIVIADRLALYVNEVYNNPADHYGFHIIFATYLFAFQIYCDFSGYSDIAIGAAKVMGIKLMDNFKRPYFATSVRDFWKRWHISLSTWFKDYLYISLGGNRVVKWRWYYNIFIVFLLSGFWHGANWTFLIWGTLHGIFVILGIVSSNVRSSISNLFRLESFPHLKRILQTAITFHLVLFSWLFFRANSLTDALLMIKNSLILNIDQLSTLKLTLTWYELSISIFSILLMEIIHIMQSKYSVKNLLMSKPAWIRFTIYYAVLFYILIFGQFEQADFIYFQF